MKKTIILLCLLIGQVCLLNAQNQRQDTLRVAVNSISPYVILATDTTTTKVTGIAVDILEKSTNRPIEYVIYTSKDEVLKAVKNETVDIGLNATITSQRMQDLAFTQPYIRSEVGVLIKKTQTPSLLQSIWNGLTDPKFLIQILCFIIVLMFICSLVGFVLYRFERRPDHMRIKTGIKGFFESVFFIFITLYSGYEDDIYKKRSKLLVAPFVLMAALVFNPILVSYYSTIFQEGNKIHQQYSTMDELRKGKIYIPPHTSLEDILSAQGVPYQTKALDSVKDKVIEGKAGYVHDKFYLMNYVYMYEVSDSLEVGNLLISDSYKGVVTSKKHLQKAEFNEFFDKLSMNFVKLRERGDTKIIASRYGVVIQ